jgi:N-acetylglucosamine-6-phosphate deacetylase
MLAFTAARLLTPYQVVEHPLLLVSEGRVVEITARADRPLAANLYLCDFGDSLIAPGYVDLHIHGNAGYDVMDASAEALPGIERMLSQHGVTSYFPTTVTAPLDQLLQALERLADAVEECEKQKADRTGRAAPLGIHLEGPFISHVRCGVHPPENLLPPKLETFDRFWQAARGRIRMMTIAPELDGAMELISAAAARGVWVSLGHSDARFDAAEQAISAGARHATHTFNAMRPLGHRDPGILGAVLTDDRVTADIIVDGVHLNPSIVKLVAQCKGPERTVLITDAISATGMPDGHYHLGSIEVEVKDGKCTSGGRLAGSVLTMDKAVRDLSRFAEWNLPQAIAAATRNPARVARLAHKGNLRAGADADFVVLNAQGEVLRTFVGGAECGLAT